MKLPLFNLTIILPFNEMPLKLSEPMTSGYFV